MAFHTFLNYPPGFRTPGVIIPQQEYQIAGQFDRLSTLTFAEHGRAGVHLATILRQDYSKLESASAQISFPGTRFSLRLRWPGYDHWNMGLHSVDGTGQPVTRAHLAFRVCRAVETFMTEIMEAGVQSTFSEKDWWIENVPLDKLYLLELRHVSAGSWQPVLCYDA